MKSTRTNTRGDEQSGKAMPESGKDRAGFFHGFRQAPLTYTVTCVGLAGGIALVVFRVGFSSRPLYGLLDPWIIGGVAAFVLGVAALVRLLFRVRFAVQPGPRDEVARWKQKRKAYVLLALTLAIHGILSAGLSWKTFQMVQILSTTRVPGSTPAVQQRLARTGRSYIYSSYYVFGAVSLACFAGSLLSLWLRQRAKRQLWRAEGKCEKCGYLLRGLTEPRCPECGTGFELPAGDGAEE